MRFQAGGGPQLVRMTNPSTAPRREVPLGAQHLAAARDPPAAPEPSGLPPFRMDVPCYTQDVPDVNGPAADAGAPEPGGGPVRRAIREHLRDFVAIGVLLVLALVTTGVILASKRRRLPVLAPGPSATTTSSSRPSSAPPRR